MIDKKALPIKQILIVIAILVVLSLLTIKPKETINTDWKLEYFEQVKIAGLESYITIPSELESSSPELEQLILEVNKTAKSAEDAVRKIIDWTYYNIKYQPNTNKFCPSETPDDIIAFGTGNCVSMTKVNLAALSKLGFAIRPTSGCISKQDTCRPLFSVEPDRVRQWVPVTEGDNELRGGLHLWLEVWIPEKGWVIVESTAGTLYSEGCNDYDVSAQSYDAYTMCYQSNLGYIQQCANF